MTDNDDVTRMLSFDPLAEAEKVTGKSYKDDKSTAGLGFFLMQDQNDRKKKVLQSLGDTHFSMKFDDGVRLFEDMGFEIIRTAEFDAGKYASWKTDKSINLWRAGVLVEMDSYGDSINGGKAWYNWRPAEGRYHWDLISSGGFTDDRVWVGDHDIREGIKHNLSRLEANGELLPVWVKRPFLWLGDREFASVDNDYTERNEIIISDFPQYVQDALGAPRA